MFLGPLVLQSAVGSWAMFGGDGIILVDILGLGSPVRQRCRDFSYILTYFGSWEMLKCEFCSRMRRPFDCQSIFGTDSDDIV